MNSYREIYIIIQKEEASTIELAKKVMTQFEKLLKEAKSGEEILNMQSCMTDNLTEDEIISLKAKYLGIDENSVRFMLAGIAEVKKRKSIKPLEEIVRAMTTVVER